jgi:hypothetical protein
MVNWVIFLSDLRNSIWTDTGLSNDVWWILILNILIPPAVKYFDFSHLLRHAKRKSIKTNVDTCPLNQREANEWFEGAPFDFTGSYTNHLLTIMTVMFFLPALPLGPVLGALAILANHYTEKLIMLTRNSPP